ncbi:MAG: ABC transporter permease [Verrucomicrobia bacterium]|nr:ABC transporter permease [Verrucomicrobiota bacterium]
MRRLKALVVKEFYQIIRDPSSILISLVLPAILLFIYGYGISLDYKHLKIGLVLEDTSPDAQSFTKSLTDSDYFSIRIGRDRNEFNRELIDGTIRGIVVIPSYFSSFRQRTDQIAPIQVIADGSEPNTANFVQNYVRSAFQNWLVQEKISSDWNDLSLVNLEPRYWFNEELESRNFLIPGSIALIMTLIGTLLTSLVVAREWERGTMESLMATPVTITELVLGKLLSYFILGMISFIFSTSIALFLYHVPLRGSWVLLAFTTMIFLWTALGLGLLISTASKNQFVASQAALISAFLPAFMLSGFIFEISSMPFFIRCMTYIIPARYYVSCLQTIFLAGNVWELILYNMAMMAALGLFLFLYTAHKTVKRLD